MSLTEKLLLLSLSASKLLKVSSLVDDDPVEPVESLSLSSDSSNDSSCTMEDLKAVTSPRTEADGGGRAVETDGGTLCK